MNALNELPKEARYLLEDPFLGFCATLGPKGHPQCTALWFMYEDGYLLISLIEGQQKLTNLRKDPRVTIAVADHRTQLPSLEVRGRVFTIEEDKDMSFAKRLADKYDSPFAGVPGAEHKIVYIEPYKFNFLGAPVTGVDQL